MSTAGGGAQNPSILRDRRVARVIDREIAPVWNDRFARLIYRNLPQRNGQFVLDLHCGPGHSTAEILQRLDDTSRVLAIEPDETLVEIAKTRVRSEWRNRVYFKAGNFDDVTSMAASTYDLVVANLVLAEGVELAPALGELMRVTKPGGHILGTLPLAGTWDEVEDIFAEVLRDAGLTQAVRRLERLRTLRPPAPLLGETLRQLGLGRDHFVVEHERLQMIFPSGREFLFAPVVEHGPLRLWKAIIGSDGSPQELFWRLKESIDTYYAGHVLAVSVVAGLVHIRIPDNSPGLSLAARYWAHYPGLDQLWGGLAGHISGRRPALPFSETDVDDFDLDIDMDFGGDASEDDEETAEASEAETAPEPAPEAASESGIQPFSFDSYAEPRRAPTPEPRQAPAPEPRRSRERDTFDAPAPDDSLVAAIQPPEDDAVYDRPSTRVRHEEPAEAAPASEESYQDLTEDDEPSPAPRDRSYAPPTDDDDDAYAPPTDDEAAYAAPTDDEAAYAAPTDDEAAYAAPTEAERDDGAIDAEASVGVPDDDAEAAVGVPDDDAEAAVGVPDDDAEAAVGVPDDDAEAAVGVPDDDAEAAVGVPDDDAEAAVGVPDDDAEAAVGVPDDDAAAAVGVPDDDAVGIPGDDAEAAVGVPGDDAEASEPAAAEAPATESDVDAPTSPTEEAAPAADTDAEDPVAADEATTSEPAAEVTEEPEPVAAASEPAEPTSPTPEPASESTDATDPASDAAEGSDAKPFGLPLGRRPLGLPKIGERKSSLPTFRAPSFAPPKPASRSDEAAASASPGADATSERPAPLPRLSLGFAKPGAAAPAREPEPEEAPTQAAAPATVEAPTTPEPDESVEEEIVDDVELLDDAETIEEESKPPPPPPPPRPTFKPRPLLPIVAPEKKPK
ncbi:MAG: methyltransferase domain-containing protein [Nannocystaceae bacterium]